VRERLAPQKLLTGTEVTVSAVQEPWRDTSVLVDLGAPKGGDLAQRAQHRATRALAALLNREERERRGEFEYPRGVRANEERSVANVPAPCVSAGVLCRDTDSYRLDSYRRYRWQLQRGRKGGSRGSVCGRRWLARAAVVLLWKDRGSELVDIRSSGIGNDR
jgi:hypothetical protein